MFDKKIFVKFNYVQIVPKMILNNDIDTIVNYFYYEVF